MCISIKYTYLLTRFLKCQKRCGYVTCSVATNANRYRRGGVMEVRHHTIFSHFLKLSFSDFFW